MKPVRLLFLLLGVICLLLKKTLCTSLYEQVLSKADDLDDDWFSEYANGRSYRDNPEGGTSKPVVETPPNVDNKQDDNKQNDNKQDDNKPKYEGGGGGEDDDIGGGGGEDDDVVNHNNDDVGGEPEEGAEEVTKTEDEPDATQTEAEDSDHRVENENKLNADVDAGDDEGGKDVDEKDDDNDEEENVDDDDEEEEVEDENEDDDEEEDDVQEEEEDDDDEDDDDEDDEDDDDHVQEERPNVPNGGAKVSFEKVVARNKRVSEKGVEEEEPSPYRNRIPAADSLKLMEKFEKWKAANSQTSESSKPLLPQSSGRPGTPIVTSAGAGGSPIILPIVFVPFDMRTNRVNMPAQMLSHSLGRPGFGASQSGGPPIGHVQGYGRPPVGHVQGYGQPPIGHVQGRPPQRRPLRLPPPQGAPNPRDLQLLVVPVQG